MSIASFFVQSAVSFVTMWAFSVFVQAPREQYVFCGFVGAAGWASYLALHAAGQSIPLASFGAVIALTFLSRIFSAWRRCPSTVFLIPGIFPLVPGAGIYYTAYYFIIGENELCAQNGAVTIKTAMAIALAIVLVMALPNGFFRLFASKAGRGAGKR